MLSTMHVFFCIISNWTPTFCPHILRSNIRKLQFTYEVMKPKFPLQLDRRQPPKSRTEFSNVDSIGFVERVSNCSRLDYVASSVPRANRSNILSVGLTACRAEQSRSNTDMTLWSIRKQPFNNSCCGFGGRKNRRTHGHSSCCTNKQTLLRAKIETIEGRTRGKKRCTSVAIYSPAN